MTLRTLLPARRRSRSPNDARARRLDQPDRARRAGRARARSIRKPTTTAQAPGRRASCSPRRSAIVYRIDLVNAPIALGVKELKIGTIGARAIRYDKTGSPTCVLRVQLPERQGEERLGDRAAATSAIIDPAVAKAMRDDLTRSCIALAPRRAAAPTSSRVAGVAGSSAAAARSSRYFFLLPRRRRRCPCRRRRRCPCRRRSPLPPSLRSLPLPSPEPEWFEPSSPLPPPTPPWLPLSPGLMFAFTQSAAFAMRVVDRPS